MNRIRVHMREFMTILVFLCFSGVSVAQDHSGEVPDQCDTLMGRDYVSDDQDYVARLNKNNTARFHTVFYGDNRYCIAVCSNIEEHPLIVKIFDTERNLLFDNTKHDHTPYWHLAFSSTVACVIEVKVKAEKHVDQLVKLLIGFKKPSYLQ